MLLPRPVRSVARIAWRDGRICAGQRTIPEETAVALIYNRVSHAVMMATPSNLEDFAIGFSLTDGIVKRSEEIETLEIVPTDLGIELRMWIAARRGDALADRRRHLAGPTGWGYVGSRALNRRCGPRRSWQATCGFSAQAVCAAIGALPSAQQLNHQARAVHAAAFWEPGRGLVALREDIGRHNALDKLAGALARAGTGAGSGVVLLTSRVSVELVQKVAVLGAPVIVAVSAPTALAVQTADAAGITLAAIARDDGFELFTHPRRIDATVALHVA